MRNWWESKDVAGNEWPNWKVELVTPRTTQLLTRAFNSKIFQFGNLLYPKIPYKGLPLPETTRAYLIHNETFKLQFTELTARRSRRCTNEFCQISLAFTEAHGFPALTGSGPGRVMHVVSPDFQDLTKNAIYRLDVPKVLSSEATAFDLADAVERFELIWDNEEDYLHSPVPSRGRIIRSHTAGLGSSGGWSHERKDDDKYRRPTIRELLREYE